MNGRRKRIFIGIVCVLAIVALAIGVAACSKPQELPEVTPVSWEVYLEEAAERIADSVRLNGNRINLTLDMTIDRKDNPPLGIFAGLNYDFADPDASMLVVTVAEGERNLISVASDNDSTFVDIVPNPWIGDAKLHLTQLNLFDWLSASYRPDRQDGLIGDVKNVLIGVGKGMFCDVEINREETRFAFKVAPDCFVRGADHFRTVFGLMGETFESLFLKAFGAEDVDGFLAALPRVAGKIVFDFGQPGVVAVSGGDFSVDGVPSETKAQLTTAYDFDDGLIGYFPADDSGYVTTKLGNTGMSGTVDLSDGGVGQVRYNFELNANLDLTQLLLGDYDFSALDEDNYFHFRLSHVCTDRCGVYCEQSLGAARGAVLDIGFSPRDFGTDYIYCAIDLNSLIVQSYAEELSDRAGMSLTYFFPDYVLFALPYDSVKDGPLARLFAELLRLDRLFFDDTIEIGVDDGVPDFLKEFSQPVRDLASQRLLSDRYKIDRIDVRVNENRFGEAQQYDIYKETVYIIDDEVSEVKDYGTDIPLLGYRYISPLSWTFESMRQSEDGALTLSNLYDAEGNLMHGIDEQGAYVPMSPSEAEGITAMYLSGKYVKHDKITQSDFKARILAVEGLDPTARSVQEVVLKAECPSPFHTIGMKTLFGEAQSALFVEVKARIKLTDFSPEGTEFEQDLEGDTFLLTRSEREPPAFMQARVTLRYAGGISKSLSVLGVSDAVVAVDNIFSIAYSVIKTGPIQVSFTVGNRVFERTFTVREPDSVAFEIDQAAIGPFGVGDTVYFSSLTSRIKMYAYYNLPDGVKKVDVLLRAADFYINGIPLSNSSSDWSSQKISESGSYTVTFRKANDYLCTVRKNGRHSDPFVLSVQPANNNYPRYRYQQISDPVDFWFADVNYTVSGEIANSLHGETPDRQTPCRIEVEILKGELVEIGGSGYIDFSIGRTQSNAGETEFYVAGAATPYATLTGLRFGNESASGNGLDAVIPDLIVTPIKLDFGFRFSDSGYYRIRLRAEGDYQVNIVVTWDIYVGRLSNIYDSQI